MRFHSPIIQMGLREQVAMKLPNTNEVMAESLTRMLMEGPEVSLSGSPTVSPITAAACSGSPFLTQLGLSSDP